MTTRNDPAPYRPVAVAEASVRAWRDGDEWRFSCPQPLGDYPARLTDRLIDGAERFPQRTLVAQRDQRGDWVRLSYREMLQRVRRLGQALLNLGLSEQRPLLILSGNDLPHLQLALAALYTGVPYCPVSPAYSLLSKDFGKLEHIISLITPGLVYASDGGAFTAAIQARVAAGIGVVTEQGGVDGRVTTCFTELLETEPDNVDDVSRAVTPEHIAKFLFTSGSTSLPKAVITTQRMLSANQQMLRQTFPCFAEEPPVLLDWLPWNHTFGGSHNVGIALYNGGSYYIDDGKPTEEGFAATVANLRDISPTVFLNVPKGWELLADALEADADLRDAFYARMKLFFFAGAGLSQAVWDRLDRISEVHCGERIRVMSSLGMTETAPACTFTTGPLMVAGYVGVPAPGCEVKLVPEDDKAGGKYEVRFRGPHVMPGYWRMPEKTREAFDDDGFYRTGDALRLVDPERPEQGLMFDGRLAEDFKLASGTFVSVGPLRARLMREGAPCVQDAVITGLNRDVIGVLVFPRLEPCRRLSGLPVGSTIDSVLTSAPVIAFFRNMIARINADASGSATRLAFIHVLETPPDLDFQEITDKGSINQRAVLEHRAALVDRLYRDQESGTWKGR